MERETFYGSLVEALAKYGYRFHAKDITLHEIEVDKWTATVAIATDLVPSLVKALIGSSSISRIYRIAAGIRTGKTAKSSEWPS